MAGQAPSVSCGGECPGIAQGASLGRSQCQAQSECQQHSRRSRVLQVTRYFHERFQAKIRTKWPFLNRMNTVSEFIICLLVMPAEVSAQHYCPEPCSYSQSCIQLFPLLSQALEQGLESSGSEGFGQCLPMLFSVLTAS